jgi:hypothetical protein
MISLEEKFTTRKKGQMTKTESKKKKTIDKAALIEKAIQSMEEKLDSNEMKATIGDFIRLLQLQKEIEGERPQEIKVTWVESETLEPVSVR